MENYPNNSFKAREASSPGGRSKDASPPEKHVEKVITGAAKTVKKSGFKKFIGLFVSDEIDNSPGYLWRNIVLPAIKRTISDCVEIGLNGETDRRRMSGSSIVSEYRGGNNAQNRTRYDIQNLYEIDDVILDTYGDCEAVLDEMRELIEQYGMVSVNDLYDLLGTSGTRHTDSKYGWTSLRTAKIVPARGGFMLKLPRVVPLN